MLPLAFPGLGFADPRTGYGEGGVDHPAGDGGDAVRLGLAGRGVAVVADIGLEGDVADGVVGDHLHPRGGAEAHRRLGEPVQRVVLEALGERGVGIAAGQQLVDGPEGGGERESRLPMWAVDGAPAREHL
jgi:hypothetical protein